MTVLIEYLKTIDDKLLSDLITIVEPQKLNKGNKTDIIDKPIYIVEKM
jgi:hypothetical protein